VNPVRVRNPA